MNKTIKNIKEEKGLDPIPPTSGSNISKPIFKEIDKIKKEFASLPIQPLDLKPDERSFEYYKGFYDATHKFMQTFEKLIEAGAFCGTKTNSHN